MGVPVDGTHAACTGEEEGHQYHSYNLPKGKWQANFGYRHFRSFRHFVGDVEQNAENEANGTAERDRAGTNVINHVHQPLIGVTYGLTDRLSLSADLPYFQALRRSPWAGSRPTFATSAHGISDLVFTGRYWVGDPRKSQNGNLSVGVGLKLPTGNDRAEDEFLVRLDPDGNRITEVRPVDQSIQPGDGGWGILTEVQAFKGIGRFVAFASGAYLMNPQEMNDFNRNGPSAPVDDSGAENHLLSIADQYVARVGVSTSVWRNLGANLGLRIEGTTSSDLIGGDRGRRRPGYTLGLDPGVAYMWRGNALSVNVPIAIRRVRTQNYADKLETEQTGEFANGDAAFADYAIVVAFSHRF
jgi:hypothetical protein